MRDEGLFARLGSKPPVVAADGITREVLSDIAAFTVHGGRVELARAAFPGKAEWIDLSTGVSPWSYPAAFEHAVLQSLPEPGALAGLEAAAAAVFGSNPAFTVAVPGSDIALRLLGRLIPAKAPAVVGPGYSGHLAMWDGPEVISAIGDHHDAVVLARPNNPDGAVIGRENLEAAAQDLAGRDGWLIVDEAFADASADAGIAAARWPATIVLRSFGKFFGLAGLRLGFVIAPPELAAALRRVIGDWPMSGPSIAIGTAAYRDIGWQAAQRKRLEDTATRLDALVTAAGLPIAGGTSFFRLLDVPDAATLFEHFARHGILTRPFADNPRRLRLGLPADAAQMSRLAAALQTMRLS